jgi:hypothetical protein
MCIVSFEGCTGYIFTLLTPWIRILRRWQSLLCLKTRILWELNTHYRVYKSPSIFLISSHVNPIYFSHPVPLRFILIVSSSLRLGLKWSRLFRFSNRNYVGVCISHTSCLLYDPSILFFMILLHKYRDSQTGGRSWSSGGRELFIWEQYLNIGAK